MIATTGLFPVVYLFINCHEYWPSPSTTVTSGSFLNPTTQTGTTGMIFIRRNAISGWPKASIQNHLPNDVEAFHHDRMNWNRPPSLYARCFE